MPDIPVRPRHAVLDNRRWQRSCHPGLAMEKFAPSWVQTGTEVSGKDKQGFFSGVAGLIGTLKGGGDKRLWDHFRKRREAFFQSLKGSGWEVTWPPMILKTQWRLVSGLGIAHPFETGFVFDHTYGVPFLPGSSVKGAARAWAKEMKKDGQKDGWDATRINLIFGSEGKAPEPGSVAFFDVYPTDWPEIDIDIINPHYAPYYADGKTPPADWHSPIPNYFLTVKPHQQFEFVVAAKPDAQNNATLASKAMEAVTGAAKNLGLGGKTAVGYGYFE